RRAELDEVTAVERLPVRGPGLADQFLRGGGVRLPCGGKVQPEQQAGGQRGRRGQEPGGAGAASRPGRGGGRRARRTARRRRTGHDGVEQRPGIDPLGLSVELVPEEGVQRVVGGQGHGGASRNGVRWSASARRPRWTSTPAWLGVTPTASAISVSE